ncbi:MAG: hypothetical protein A2234_07855 [Elusimicrobia bacterium RIFOXYA2_FULL_58_8]|nr:MAG: hypothetical protein A2234_07855 [Elusimicrobia bacterium RIFOXYA2_FULL_58_8]
MYREFMKFRWYGKNPWEARGASARSLLFPRVAATWPAFLLFSFFLLRPVPPVHAATTVFLGDTVSSVDPGSDDERRLNRSRGSAAVTYFKNTLVGTITPPDPQMQITRTAGGTPVVWYSDPLDAVTISGNVTFNIWARESNKFANAGLAGELLRTDSSGNILSVIASVVAPASELATSFALKTWTRTPAPTALSNGDRLALRLYMDNFGTMAANYTVQVSLDGPTAGASGDSWFRTVEALAPARPAPGAITSLTQTQLAANWTLIEGATGYTLAASVNPGASPSPIYASAETSDSSAQLASPALSPNTTYYPYVRSNGPGASSSWAPYGLVVTPAYAPSFTNFTQLSSYTAQFNWAANGNTGSTLYHVVMSTASDPLAPFGAVVKSTYTYSLFLSSAGLSANTAYSFRVAAVNHAGVYTDYTPIISTYTLAAMPVAGAFSGVTESDITLGWASGGNGAGTLYRLFVSTAPDPVNPGGAAVTQHETYNFSASTAGLAANTTYYFKAAAVNGDGVLGQYFSVVSTATRAAPPVFSAFSEEAYASLRFSWSAGGNPAGTLYRVLSSTASDPGAPGGAAVASSNTYNVSLSTSGLAADTRYYFRVAAINRNGVVTAYTAPENRATLLRFTPSTAAFTGVAESAAQFNYSANGNLYPGTLFRVLASTAPNPASPGGAAVSSSDTYNASLNAQGLEPNTTYYFRAAGVNKDGVLTSYSAIAGTSTLAAVPSGLNFTQISSGALRLDWDQANGPGTLYRVTVSTAADPLAPAGAAVTSSDTYNLYLSTVGLADAKAYAFRVRAINNNGILTAWSAVNSTSTLALGTLAAPLAGALVPYVSSITAAWQLVGGATGYTLAASLSADNPPTVIYASSTTLGGSSAAVPGLSPDTVYYLFIRSNGPGLASSWNAYSPAATLLQYAPAFGSFGTITASTVSLSWSGGGNPGGTLYRVLSSTAPNPLAPAGAAVVSSDTYALALSSVSLPANTAYYFRIAGVNKDGALTAWTTARGTSTLAVLPVPSGFSGSGVSALTFSWSENGNPAGTLYRVLSSRAPDPLAPGAEPVASSDTYSLTLSTSGLQPNTTYYFRAAAVNNDGVLTAYSAVQSSATRPETPAYPGFGTVGAASIDFMWDANGNPAGTPYRVLVSPALNPLDPGVEAVTSAETYDFYFSSSGLLLDKAYYFVVAAVGRDGQPGAYTAPQRARTLTLPPVSSGFSGVATNSLDFNWSVNGNYPGTLYRVAVSPAPDPLSPGGETVTLSDSYAVSVTTSGLAANTTYYFRAASVNGDGVETAYTAPAGTATLVAYAPLVSGFSDIQTDSIRILWSANGNADGTLYRIAVSTAPDPLNPGAAPVAYGETAELSYAAMNLAVNTLYYFRVAGVNHNGVTTAYSSPQSERTLQNVTKFYLLDDVSPANPDAGEEHRLSRQRGAAEVSYVKNTVSNPAPPATATQFTKVGNGAVQTWYTGPLDPVTIVSSVTFNIWARESATAANASITAELLRANNAGVIQSVVAAVHVPLYELSATTLQSWTWTVQPAQTVIALGDRLAVRLHIDNVGTMSTGRTVTVSLGGPTLNASGDTWVQVLEDIKPAKPAAMSVTGITASQVSASWSQVGEITDYTLASSVNPGTEPSPVYSSSDTVNLSATLSLPSLSPNTTYYLFARSNAPGASSGWQVYPATATLLAYAPVFNNFSSVASGSMLFSWSANGNAYPGTLYRVVSSTAPDPLSPGGAVVSSSYTYNTYLSTSGLAADTTYFFRVAGLNHANVATAYTAPVGTATLLAFPPASPTFSNIGTAAIQFNWSANGNLNPGTLYRVLASTAPDPSNPGGAAVTSSSTYNTFLSSSGLAVNTTYYFTVAGVSKNGVATAYTAVKGTSTWASAPSSPALAAVGASSAVFSWSAPSNPSGRTLYLALVSTASNPLAPLGAVVSSSYTYNLSLSTAGLAADTTYYFTAAAVNNNGVVTAYTSVPATATLLAYAPAVSGFGAVTASAAQFLWSANGNAYPGTLFRVLSSTAPNPLSPAGAVVRSSYTYSLSLSSSGLAADTTCYFAVAGVNKNGVETAYSAVAGTATLLAFTPSTGAFSGVSAGGVQFNFAANGNVYPGTQFRVLSSTAPDPANPGGAAVFSSYTYVVALASSSLAPNTTYYFRAAGVNKNGVQTAYSAVAATSTLANAPSGLYSTGVTTIAIRLNWSGTGNGPLALYSVLVSTAADPLVPAGAKVTSSDTYNLYASTAGLAPSTDYNFRVRARNNNGLYTAWTTPPFLTRTLATGEIGSPASGNITGVFVSSLSASWSLVSGATGYTLAASLSAVNPPTAIAASSTTINNGPSAYVFSPALAADTIYYLFVRANGDSASGSWLAFPPKATLLANPPAFSGFSGVNSSVAQFGWSQNGNAYPGTLFRVLVSTAPDPLTPGAAVVTSSDTYNISLTTTGLAADTTYYFRAVGVNKDGALTAYTAVQATATWANTPVPAGFTGVGAAAIQFNWMANGNRNPGTRYRVLVSTAPDPSNSGGAVVTSSDTYNLYLSTAGLTADVTYYFRAAALGVGGMATAYSAPAGTATLVAYPPAAAGFTGIGASSIQFNWTPNGNRDPGTRYRVLASTAPNPLSPGGAVVSSSYTYNLFLSSAGLAVNTSYYFLAAAVNQNGIETAYTAAAGTATLANLPLTAVSTFSVVTSGGFTAAWNANANPAGTLYAVQVSTAGDFNAGAAGQAASTAPLAGASYSFSGLLSNRDYYFRLRAVNRNGVYTSYAELGSTRTLGLSAPSGLGIGQVSTYSITASWSLVDDATGYTLAASVNSGVSPSPIYASSAATGLSAAVFSPDLDLNTTYYLFVKAGGPGDASPWSVFPPASTLANIPVAAGQAFTDVAYDGFSINWGGNSNPAATTRYTVQISTAPDFNPGATNGVIFTTVAVDGPKATFSGVASDTYYYARVRAEHNNGAFTDWLGLGNVKTLIQAALHAAGDGVLFYGQSGNSMPQFRDYGKAANSFSAVRPTVAGASGAFFTIRTNPLTSKQEAVAAYVSNGTLRVLCTDGANWYEEWTQNVGGIDGTRRFDVAFETNSGDAVVLYSRNVSGTNELGYRTKPGSAACGTGGWSSAATLDPARTSGNVQWVKMASDRRADYDNIIAIWADASSVLSAMVWNGSAWENEPASALEASLERVAASQDVESFAVEVESLSGDIMVTWGHSGGTDGTNGVRYATALWTGGTPEHTWGSPTAAPTFVDDATNLDLAANPASNEMVFASIGNAGSDLQAGYWSGSAWTNKANHDITAQTPLVGTRLVAAAWISSGTATRSVITYNDAATTNIGWVVGNLGTFTTQTPSTPAPLFANPQRYYDLKQDPVNRDRLIFTLADSNSDLFAKRLVMTAAAGFTWANADGSSALETSLASSLGGYSFMFWPSPPTTTFEQIAFRFFENTATTDVGPALAAQDALAVLPAAGAAFRLRTLVNIGQVDLPVSGQAFKLQFAGQGDGTCAAPSNGTPAAYTDVTSLSAVAFNNNAPADRAALTANAADPQHGVFAALGQVYAESNGFSNSVSGINRGRDGMWDLALKDNGMAPGAVYCLRLVRSDDVPLESYGVYPRVVSPAALYLNEVYPSSGAAAGDWVEFYNNSQSTVPLTGWKLEYIENTIAMGGTAATVWTGQAGQYVNARSTFLVTGFLLDLNAAQSYHVRLLDASGSLLDRVQWPGPGTLSPGQSFSRISDGHPDYFEIDPTPTPGYANSVSTDPFSINEVSYGSLVSEFIELYNASPSSTFTLYGYSLRNAAASASGQVFRFSRKIYPQDFTALDGSSLSGDALSYQTVFGADGLASAGDFLALENSNGSTVNQLTWQSGAAYSRYDRSGQLVAYSNPAPAGAGTSIARGPSEGSHTGTDSADFSVSAFTTLASRNNSAAGADDNELYYPDPSGGTRYLSRYFPLRLALGENSVAGRGNNIVFSRAGGAADPGSPHIYRLQDIGFSLSQPPLTQQATAQFGLEFRDQDGQAPVSGAYYRFILNSDNGAASAQQVILSSVAYDASIHSVSVSSPPAPVRMNEGSGASALRLDLFNNSPTGFNGVEIATVAFSLFREDLITPLNTLEAMALFDAIMLVGDSTSTGLSGTYESAIDVATAAYVPMEDIALDGGVSTLTVATSGLGASFAAAGSTRSFYLVFVATRSASSKPLTTFRVSFDPVSGTRVRDASGLLAQDFTPGAQVDTASFTIIAPALPPQDTAWPYPTESSAPITGTITSYSRPLLPEARLYLPSSDGSLIALSTTGAKLWTFTLSPQTPLSVTPSFPQEEGGSVYLYFAGGNGDVYKIRDQGGAAAQEWKTSLGSEVKSLLDTDTRLYIPVAGNKVYCLDKLNGQPCSGWTFSSAVTAAPAGTPCVDERDTVTTAWIGLEDGKIVSLKTGDGTSNNTFLTGGPVKSSPFLDAYAAGANNVLYVTSTDGIIYAINSGNMSSMNGWNDFDTESAIYSSPFVWALGGTKYVFFGADNGKLYKLNAASGDFIWSFQAGGAIRSTPLMVPAGYIAGLVAGEDYVYFGSDDGNIYGVNANTGQPRIGWPVATGGPVRADPVADNDTKTISVGSNDGRLYTIYIGP